MKYTWSNNGTGCTVNTIVPAGQLCTISILVTWQIIAAAGTSAFSVLISARQPFTVNIGDNSYFQTTPTYSVSGNSNLRHTSQAVHKSSKVTKILAYFKLLSR